MKYTKIFALLLIIYTSAQAQFPDSFKWCVSTAAHQIEGNNYNSDWWNWETIPGKIKDDQQSMLAANHWNMVEKDIELINFLHASTYRFSISWAKIEPQDGNFDQEALKHYKQEIELLIKNNITPMVTLFHFVLPQWVADQGGWTNPKTIKHFVRFADYLYLHFGDKVKMWITLNEPMVYAAAAYLTGIFPPGKTDINQGFEAGKNMLIAHQKIYHHFHLLAKEKKRQVQIGLAHHMRVYRPYNPLSILDFIATYFLEQAGNWAFRDVFKTGQFKLHIPFMINKKAVIKDIVGTQDFFGLNYYSRDIIKFSFKSPDKVLRLTPPKAETSDLGWEIYPKGMGKILQQINRKFPTLPIFITENGIADENDIYRPDFLVNHLRVVKQSIDKGVNIEGYCHWSLIDNFEWAEGREPRFGLFEVNYQTFERIPRPSAYLFREIAKNNSLL